MINRKIFYKKNRLYIISLLIASFLIFIFNFHYARKFETSFIEEIGYTIFDFELCSSCKKLNQVDPRQFQTIGIFDWERRKTEKILLNPIQERVYNILVQKGYTPTPWEIVFRGQITSLVGPYGDGRAEIHVRFYKDRIFAEYEIGRAFLQHVLSERYFANHYLEELVSPALSDEDKIKFHQLTDVRVLSLDEQSMKKIRLQQPIGSQEESISSEKTIEKTPSEDTATGPFDSYLLVTWKLALYLFGSSFIAVLGSKGLIVSAFIFGFSILFFSFMLPGK